jgi:hypothetical protein
MFNHPIVVIQMVSEPDLLSALQLTGNTKLDKLLVRYADRFPASLPKLSDHDPHATPLYDGHTIPLPKKVINRQYALFTASHHSSSKS